MEKIKIKLDTPGIPDEKISGYKNFDKLYQMVKVPGKPFFKSAKFITGASSAVVITAIVSVVLYQNVIKQSPVTKLTPPDTINKSFTIKPSIPGQDVLWEYYSLENENGGDIVTQSGTVLHIPGKAFVDSAGNKIAPPVKIRYREFRNAVDYFRAGIPMNYDSCNADYLFESAGMFEIGAAQDGKNLRLDKGKKINVDLLSATDEKRFNFYTFDTTRGKWVHIGKDKIRPYIQTGVNKDTYKDTLATMNEVQKLYSDAVTPVEPVLATKDKYVFKLEISEKEFPELVAYKKILFQVDERGNKFDKMLYSVRWDQISLKSSGQKGLYDLYLTRKDTSVHLKVVPVFDQKNYQAALDRYQAELKKNQIQNEQNLDKKQAQLNTENIVNEIVKDKGFIPSSVRSVSIMNLGLFNCDFPMPKLPNTISPEFTDNSGRKIDFRMLCIADKSNNLLGYYFEGEAARYRRGSVNLMWILTWDGKIGIIDPVRFKEIAQDNKPKIVVNLLEDAEGIKQLYQLINS